ncbi:diiron oxygenase [SAR86 cluster bacterium]|nr:diiron oxygenase [SAR86 cluster bacterium]
MKITQVKETPRKIKEFPVENELGLSEEQVENVAEIFQTPLTGAYNWDYTIQDNRIKRLYELGKELNWNASTDIDWSQPMPEAGETPPPMFWDEYKPYQDLSNEDKFLFLKHRGSWSLSQFLHGEQGALLVASQLVSCAPTFNAKLYAASQTFDEARHVEAFNKYIQTRQRLMYPIGNGLKSLLDKILTDPRWDLKFIGMQIIIEGLALAAFNVAKQGTSDPVFKDMLYLIIRDEARHVTFGVNYLEEYLKTLSEEELEERAQFAYEACMVMRGRLMSNDVYTNFGWDVEEAQAFALKADVMNNFQHLLFTRVVPNLSRIGLLTDRVRPLYEELGVLEYENWPTDGDIDWVSLEKPLDTSKEIA